MVPTIVGLAVTTLGLVAWVCWLHIVIYDIRAEAALAIDAQTTLYIKLDNRLKLIEPPEYPKYLGTITGSQIVVDDERECGTPDPVWGEHDERVKQALTQAQRPAHRVITADPEQHPFFVTDEISEHFDDDTAHRLSMLGKAVKETTE